MLLEQIATLTSSLTGRRQLLDIFTLVENSGKLSNGITHNLIKDIVGRLTLDTDKAIAKSEALTRTRNGLRRLFDIFAVAEDMAHEKDDAIYTLSMDLEWAVMLERDQKYSAPSDHVGYGYELAPF
jgi:hypothetical protein